MAQVQIPTEAFEKLLLTVLSAALELDGDKSELAPKLIDAVAAAVGVPAEDCRWAGEVWCDLLIDGVIGDEPFREFLKELRAGPNAPDA